MAKGWDWKGQRQGILLQGLRGIEAPVRLYSAIHVGTHWKIRVRRQTKTDIDKTCKSKIKMVNGFRYYRALESVSIASALSTLTSFGSSATPFQFIFIIDCQPHPTPYRR